MAALLKGVMQHSSVPRARRLAAFTMVELALCIAVVAVAMVAIIGVLPAGLNSQQINREETIVNQDASVLLEAIRSGAWLTDDITNYVDYILVVRQSAKLGDGAAPFTNGFSGVWFSNPQIPKPATKLTAPLDVIGLLSMPKYESIPDYDAYFDSKVPGEPYYNTVIAQFRAFSGSLNEKPMLPKGTIATPGLYESSFRYQLRVEISPVRNAPLGMTNGLAVGSPALMSYAREKAVRHSLYDVSLTFQWPVFGTDIPGRVGGNVRTVRTQVEGRLLPLYFNGSKTPYTVGNSSVVPRSFNTSAASAKIKLP